MIVAKGVSVATKSQHLLVGRLVDLQRAFALSGNEMARRLDINPSTWTRLVAGDVQPSLRVVQAAVAAFPELRPFCVQLLMIRTDSSDDVQDTARAAV